MSIAGKGRKHGPMSQACRDWLSRVKLGKKKPVGFGYKMRIIHLGRKRSPETCAAISAGNKGRVVSTETRRKISEAHKRRYAAKINKENLGISELSASTAYPSPVIASINDSNQTWG